jgi:hypothetical protein
MLQMHKENYENHPKFCKQKFIPMHPILEVPLYSLWWRYFLLYITCKSRHKKVQHLKNKNRWT